MDFKVTNWLERNYKWLSALVVGSFTTYAIYYYLSLCDKSDTFVVALGYALVLFLAGIFLNYMNNANESKIDDRIDIYNNLQIIESILDYVNDMGYLERVKSRIISFQIATGREESQQDRHRRPMISERGIKFNASELVIEKEFTTAYEMLKSRLIQLIQTYYQENGMPANTRTISVNSISLFKPNEWCKENLHNYDEHGRRMTAFLYKQMETIRGDIEALEIIGQKVMQLYDRYQDRASKNIKQIERIYGRKLQYKILQKNDLQENFRFVLERIYEVEDRLSVSINEHDDKIEDYVREIHDISEAVNDLRVQIEYFQQ